VSATDDLLDAIYKAIERFEREERSAANWRSVVGKANAPKRVTTTARGDRIVTPRRSALARYVTDAVLTQLRSESEPIDFENDLFAYSKALRGLSKPPEPAG
jgi:hypothetical protein